MPNTSTHKQCPACGQVKPRTEFYRKRWFDRRRGREYVRTSPYCQPCEIAMVNVRRAHRYRTDPEFRDRLRRQNARYARRKRAERAEDRRWLLRAAQQHIAALRAAGWTVNRIAAALGVCRDSVARWSRGELGIKPERLHALRRLAHEVGEAG